MLFLVLIGMMLSLVACGGAQESGSPKNEESVSETKEDASQSNKAEKQEEEVEADEEVDVEAETETDADVFESSSDKEDQTVQSSGNLFDKNKVFEYDNGSIVMTLTNAEFTTKFGASNADPEDSWAYRQINSDSETYLHITGTILNDTTNSLSFGNVLGSINFRLLYDGKHEFENTSSAEEENGTKLGASSIGALSEGSIHVSFQVPKTVAESDKPLVLTVTMFEEPFEIQLR